MGIARDVEALEALRRRPRRLLAVFPHPDDESYGPGGALSRAGNDPAAAAVLFCLTRGEASSMGKQRGITPEEVARIREERLEEIARQLPLDGLLVGRYPDGGLARSAIRDVAGAIADVLRALDPQVVVAHDPRGVNAHPDHIATHWALRLALTEHPPVRLAMVAYPPEVAESIKPRLLFPTPEEEIDAVVRLSEEEIDAKEAALRVHEAFVTLREEGDAGLVVRPPVERFDFFGENVDPPVDDLFAGLPS